jgi:hypothetical protein
MGSHRTRPAVMDYLVKHPAKPVSLTDLVSTTGFTGEQIQYVMRSLIRENYPIQVAVRAQMWVYNPEPEPLKDDEPDNRTGEVWEVVGHARSGAPILRDEHGILYRATEME